MTSSEAYSLDWRSQFANLEGYLRETGGVVHVRTGPDGPSSNFSKVLRHRLRSEQWPREWSTVQIAPSNRNLHYLSDILDQIATSAGLSLASAQQRGPNIEVLKNIRAHTVHMQDVDITVGQEHAVGDGDKVKRLCGALRTALRARRVALIFLDTHDYEAEFLRTLSRTLWDGALEKLVAHGLLLVDVSDPKKLASMGVPWPPTPSLTLDLPDRYDSDTRGHAIEDLAQLVFHEGLFPTLETATISATALLSTAFTVADAYSQLGVLLAAMRTGVIAR
jgi:hypothetical protein